jgi:hypothetical protein
MSTRSTTHFIDGPRRTESVAIIYRHADGYPEGHGVDLQRFFDDVEAQTRDTRYSDPAYLAAKLVVWLAREFAESGEFVGNDYVRTNHANERPLDFLSVGVVQRDPGRVEYVYVVDCGTQDERGRPVVKCYEADVDSKDNVVLGREVSIPVPEEVPAS